MLGAAIVPRPRVQRLRQPPQARLERRSLVTRQPLVALPQVALEQQRDVGPAAPLVARHVPRRRVVGTVCAPEVTRPVQCEASEEVAPPRDRAARPRGGERRGEAPCFDEIAHPLPGDPGVAGDGDGSVVQHLEQLVPGVADPA